MSKAPVRLGGLRKPFRKLWRKPLICCQKIWGWVAVRLHQSCEACWKEDLWFEWKMPDASSPSKFFIGRFYVSAAFQPRTAVVLQTIYMVTSMQHLKIKGKINHTAALDEGILKGVARAESSHTSNADHGRSTFTTITCTRIKPQIMNIEHWKSAPGSGVRPFCFSFLPFYYFFSVRIKNKYNKKSLSWNFRLCLLNRV